MDFFSILQLAMQYGPLVKGILDEATSNDDISTKVKALSPVLGHELEVLGSKAFPKAAPSLHLVGAVIATFDPNVTKWLQGSLNALVQPVPPLAVDGIYGTKTRTAVEVLQVQLGLKVDGIAGVLTQAAITLALSKL